MESETGLAGDVGPPDRGFNRAYAVANSLARYVMADLRLDDFSDARAA